MRNRHFGIPFSITPIKSVYSLALLGGTGILEYLFKLSLSRGCTLWHSYEEQAFWDTFSIPPFNTVYSGIHMSNRHLGSLFQFPLSRGCTPALYEEQAFWKTFFNSPYQEVVLSGNIIGNRHFGIPFSITPIKSVYSLALLGGTGILEYLFKLPLSRGCTLWHSYEEQAFWDTFSIPPINTVYSGIHMRNKHFGIPFSIPSIKRVYSLAFL